MRHVIGWVALAVAFAAAPAWAQEVDVSEPVITRSGQGWSVLTGRTVGARDTAIHAQVGWPGLYASLFHGANERLDVGGRLGLLYGFEGIATSPIVPGIKLQGALRLKLLETSRMNLGLGVKVGPFFYFYRTYTLVGLGMPLELSLGIPVSSALNVAVDLELPMYAVFGIGGYFAVPILPGAGLEYFIDQQLAATFQVRMGPTLASPYVYAPFTFEGLVGVAYRL
ncbi:MAG: hypothetical protein HYZ28_02345 [Myxococcales bacterium]|nr:hypothetical protein [Myxococcales bacterium]